MKELLLVGLLLVSGCIFNQRTLLEDGPPLAPRYWVSCGDVAKCQVDCMSEDRPINSAGTQLCIRSCSAVGVSPVTESLANAVSRCVLSCFRNNRAPSMAPEYVEAQKCILNDCDADIKACRLWKE